MVPPLDSPSAATFTHPLPAVQAATPLSPSNIDMDGFDQVLKALNSLQESFAAWGEELDSHISEKSRALADKAITILDPAIGSELDLAISLTAFEILTKSKDMPGPAARALLPEVVGKFARHCDPKTYREEQVQERARLLTEQELQLHSDLAEEVGKTVATKKIIDCDTETYRICKKHLLLTDLEKMGRESREHKEAGKPTEHEQLAEKVFKLTSPNNASLDAALQRKLSAVYAKFYSTRDLQALEKCYTAMPQSIHEKTSKATTKVLESIVIPATLKIM